MHLNRSSVAAAAACIAFVLASPRARAEETAEGAQADKLACVTALDEAQAQTSARRLKDARASFVACSSDACPAVVREDCARSLLDLDAATPSVVLSATVDGRDATDARVLLDGALLEGALDGRSIAVDPGAHRVRFERAGSAPVDVRFIAREGEKNRVVAASFVLRRTAPSRPPSPTRTIAAEGGRSLPVLPVVLGGIGLAALGGGVFLRMSADSRAQDLQSTCAPACDPAERDRLGDQLVLSNVALGVGAVALTASAVTWLLARK